MLLHDHHTMSTKSVCNSQYMVTDLHCTTGEQIKHSTLSYSVRERRAEQNGGAFRTCCGRAFHACTAATENDRSLRVERRVDGNSRVDVSAEQRC